MKNKPPTWRIKIDTDKFKTVVETSDIDELKKLTNKVKKTYGAQRIYHNGHDIIVHYVKKVGTFKTKRLDGVKI